MKRIIAGGGIRVGTDSEPAPLSWQGPREVLTIQGGGAADSEVWMPASNGRGPGMGLHWHGSGPRKMSPIYRDICCTRNCCPSASLALSPRFIVGVSPRDSETSCPVFLLPSSVKSVLSVDELLAGPGAGGCFKSRSTDDTDFTDEENNHRRCNPRVNGKGHCILFAAGVPVSF